MFDVDSIIYLFYQYVKQPYLNKRCLLFKYFTTYCGM